MISTQTIPSFLPNYRPLQMFFITSPLALNHPWWPLLPIIQTIKAQTASRSVSIDCLAAVLDVGVASSLMPGVQSETFHQCRACILDLEKTA